MEPIQNGPVSEEAVNKEIKDEKPLLVVPVSSISDYLEKVKKSGGKILSGKKETGVSGWRAQIQDTEGNKFDLWEDKVKTN
ncbi:MAG: hypothetical protein PHE88_02875 [Elusimicrobia bacterium]|nr:hypothetical protein [Elusimicrobiota bacterium]